MKTVGVVIPIYNVEKYLRECLDSVVNQTYKNLQVVLVNDGSTDENSLNIAKEYTLKDERFILFDKENGGQSTARNVGIEFFSKEYDFKNITQELKENSLVEFKLDNEDNPYNIYKIYKSSNFFKNKDELLNFKAPDIDYIIFLDSDDYWELNCIEECVPRMDGVEVVWFDYNKIYEKDCLEKKDEWTWFNCYNMGIKKDIIISDEWLDKYCNIQTFAFVWSGMIAFNYLSNQKIKFLDYIFHQDVYFGFMVFFKSNKISLLNKKIINYRIRSNATTLRQGKIGEQIILPKYLDFLSKFYNKNEDAKKYYSLFSWSKMVEKAIEDSFYDEKNIIINYFLPSLCMQLFQKDINKNLDPLNIGIYINFSKVIFKMFRLKHQNIIFNTNLYGTAKQRIQNQLCYKLGQTMIINSKSIIGILFMPIYLLSTFLNYKQDQKIYHQKIKKDPTLKLPPLENYPDYQEALKYKEHLSYKLGKILLESFKTWHKGGLFKFPFLAKGVKKYA